jgi:hypothetical protein
MNRKKEIKTIELLFDNALPLTVLVATTIALAIGWNLFARRMVDRTSLADASADDVARIWGGPLAQPQPKISWRRVDAATVELTAGELAKSTVDVELDAEYRRRGITEYPGYSANFSGNYGFHNPSPNPIFVAFSIGLPVDRSALMISDLVLLVDGVEDPTRTEYAQDGMSWTGEIPGSREATFTVKYRARGLQRYGYKLASAEQTRPVTKFEMNMIVRGVKGTLDFPVGAMSPTAMQDLPDGKKLSWKVDNLLSSFDVGVVLPDRGGVTRSLQKLIHAAPLFYLFYAFGLLYALSAVGRRARTMHLLALSGGYFLYFPLATYLTAYVAWPVACALALAGVSALAIAHAFRFVDLRSSIWVGLCQIFFLAVPAAAYLLPAHTGLILVIAGFLGLGLAMHAIGRAAKNITEEEDKEPVTGRSLFPDEAAPEARS